jgi:hypothetical protein
MLRADRAREHVEAVHGLDGSAYCGGRAVWRRGSGTHAYCRGILRLALPAVIFQTWPGGQLRPSFVCAYRYMDQLGSDCPHAGSTAMTWRCCAEADALMKMKSAAATDAVARVAAFPTISSGESSRLADRCRFFGGKARHDLGFMGQNATCEINGRAGVKRAVWFACQQIDERHCGCAMGPCLRRDPQSGIANYALIVCNSSSLSPVRIRVTMSAGSKSMPTGFLSVAERRRM